MLVLCNMVRCRTELVNSGQLANICRISGVPSFLVFKFRYRRLSGLLWKSYSKDGVKNSSDWWSGDWVDQPGLADWYVNQYLRGKERPPT